METIRVLLHQGSIPHGPHRSAALHKSAWNVHSRYLLWPQDSGETWLYFVWILNLSAHCYLWKALIHLDTITEPDSGPGEEHWNTCQIVSLILTQRSRPGISPETLVWWHSASAMSCVVFLMSPPRVWEGGTNINHHGEKDNHRIMWVTKRHISRHFQVNLDHIWSNSLLTSYKLSSLKPPVICIASIFRHIIHQILMVPIGPIYKNVKTEKA